MGAMYSIPAVTEVGVLSGGHGHDQFEWDTSEEFMKMLVTFLDMPIPDNYLDPGAPYYEGNADMWENKDDGHDEESYDQQERIEMLREAIKAVCEQEDMSLDAAKEATEMIMDESAWGEAEMQIDDICV